MDQDLQNGIIKLDISDHFPIFTILNSKIHNQCPKTKISTRTINEVSVENFKNILSLTDWNDVLGKTITNESYDQFIKKFSLIYDDCFPIKVIEIKTKNLLSPWITKGIKKSSKRKQKLYEKFLKKKSPKNEKEYKDYKQLFEKIKKDSKKKYFQEKLSFYKNDIKNTWKTLKDVIGKAKINEHCLPKKIALENKEITDQKTIAEKRNEFYVNVGPNLVSKIPPKQQ